MSTTVTITNEAREAQASALATLVNSGSVKVYAGAIPANADAALGSPTLLATCALSATAASSVTNGVITFDTITSDTDIDASGTAAFYRVFKTNGTTAVIQGTVGTSGESMTIANTSLVDGGTLAISSFTYTV